MKKISTPIFIYRSTSIVELHAHQLISDETFEALYCAKTYTIGAILKATNNLRNFQVFSNILFFTKESKDELIELVVKKSHIQLDLSCNDTIELSKTGEHKSVGQILLEKNVLEKKVKTHKEGKQTMEDGLPESGDWTRRQRRRRISSRMERIMYHLLNLPYFPISFHPSPERALSRDQFLHPCLDGCRFCYG